MTSSLADDLRDAVARRDAVVVVGAGVSIAATGGTETASWPGLLATGIERCVDLGVITAERAADLSSSTRGGAADDLIAAADEVTAALGGRGGGEYSRWLRDVFADMRASDAELLAALRDLDAVVVTTNYDSLLEQAFDVPAVVWEDQSRMQRVVRRDEPGVLHLHGHWARPASVVLGIRSYEDVLGSQHAQAVLRSLAVLKTLVLVGFGAGISDPNFRALREWMAGALAGSEYRHYRLVREDDLQAARHDHSAAERVIALSYGLRFADLSAYLRGIAPTQGRASEVEMQVPPSPKAARLEGGGFLEVEVPRGHERSQVLVDGRVAQTVAADEGVIRIRVPSDAAAPLRVRLSSAGGVGPEFVVDANATVPMPSWHRVIDPRVPIYSSPSASEPLEVAAVHLESFEAGRRYHRYFPTVASYRAGDFVTWDWDMSGVVGEAFRVDDGAPRLAWSSSGLFNGSTIGAAGPADLLGISVRPRAPALRVGERLPVRVLATFGDGIAQWPQDVTDSASLRVGSGVCSVGVGPSISANRDGSVELTATYGLHAVSTVITVRPNAEVTEFLGGFPRVCDLTNSNYGILIADQSDTIRVLRPNFRLEQLLRVNVPSTAAAGVDAFALDEEGNIYLRAIWDRSIYCGIAKSDFGEVRRIQLPDEDATPMAIAWKADLGLVIADHQQRLWRWTSPLAPPAFWTSVPVLPVEMKTVGTQLWILGGGARPGLLRVSNTGEVLGDVLASHPGIGASSFLVLDSGLLVSQFGPGRLLEVSETAVRVVAEGFLAPNALAGLGDDVLVGNFAGDSISLVRRD